MITVPNILMAIGIILTIISFFLKGHSKKIEKEVEDLSINIYQETNSIKRRLKIVEEELLLENSLPIASQNPKITNGNASTIKPNSSLKPVHSILVSQVLELNKQGLSIPEIQKRSTLTEEQIVYILKNGGK